MRTVSEIEQEIRDLVNRPRRRFNIQRDSAAFNKICSSLDVVGDTELAFEAYLKSDEHSSFGERYLAVYGVLQALFIQQDAVKHLHDALNLKYEAHPALRRIREVRNEASGHPTEVVRKKKATFNHISRMSLDKHGFTLLTTGADSDAKLKDVNVLELIYSQRNCLTRALTALVAKLQEEEMEHRKKFRNEKLVDAFPQSLGYIYEKIAEAIDGKPSLWNGAALVDSIIKAIETFNTALDSRGIREAYDDSVGQELRTVEYPLAELHRYFSNPEESKLNGQDANIFLFFIKGGVEKLVRIAEEIDEEYAMNSPEETY